MNDQPKRIEQFQQEISAMQVRSPATARDRALLRLGSVLIVVGVVISVVAYPLSHTTKDPLAQRDAIVQGLLGLSVTIAGAAVFLRYSLAQFLRFWLARFAYEQQAAADRISEQVRASTQRRI